MQAVAYWEQLLKLVPPDSEDARWLTAAVDKTRAQLAGPGATQATAAKPDKKAPPASTPTAPTAAATGTAVSGRVSLAFALAGKVQPSDTVFVFARNPQGSRMPLAVLRAKVSDLPLEFKLDDSMASSDRSAAPQASLTPSTIVFVRGPVLRPCAAIVPAGAGTAELAGGDVRSTSKGRRGMAVPALSACSDGSAAHAGHDLQGRL